VRVVLAEDEALLRQGLELVLERIGFSVVATAADGPDLVRKARAHRPDLVITDIRMPPSHTDEGLRAAVAIRAEHTGIGVLLLSHHVHVTYIQEFVEQDTGGFGYLLKQRVADIQRFSRDLKRVCAGGIIIDRTVADALTTAGHRPDHPVQRLTARQRDVLTLIAEGRSNAGIAQRLSITEKSVVAHASRIYDELGIPPHPDDHRRVLAVVRYLSVTGTG
jgi:DNA-binding NarL/FixJ family response regulator